MVNTPIPCNLKSEAKKAAKILKGFTVPTAKMGPDKLIPAGILLKAKGLAILTVVKAGFLVTARGGSGIVIAKINDGLNSGWSAPSAIGIIGLGGGFEIGAEVTDFVIILNKRSAVDAFSKGGNLTLGGNFTIAAGPLGRNLEADVALRSTAAIYTYSKTRGLFAGISVEGSGLIERKDANKKFYERDIRTYEILRGDVDPPEECQILYEVLESHKKAAEKQLVRMAKKKAIQETEERTGIKIPSFIKKSKKDKSGSASSKGWDSDDSDVSPQVSKRAKKTSLLPSFGGSSRKKSREKRDSVSSKGWDSDDSDISPQVSKRVSSTTRSTVSTRTSSSSYKSPSPTPSPSARRSTTVTKSSSSRTSRPRSFSAASTGSSDDAWDLIVKAIHPFGGQLPCDLSFKTGDEIHVMSRTNTQNDWWEGRFKGKTGIFPANYVKVLK